MSSFSGGDALQKRLAELARSLGDAKTLRVGFLEGSTYPDGESVAMVAAANEFGDPGMNRPPRPFFRRMIEENSPQWGDDIGKIAVAVKYDASTLFPLMGERIKEQLQNSIREFTEPALAPPTVARKGFEKPLIETSHMLNSVDYDVKDGV
ncbi:hypothetical protein QM543_07430 [Pantoea eucrina]|uniref:hypothetical protein n=1 Tax=Pantoea eucrina TaxID=472693 RepID=UPI0024B76BCB|nr:hypothetical protein [Pantoea eucrina]MDJ0023113.1 hypothetical protein [Pantoea eucrina]